MFDTSNHMQFKAIKAHEWQKKISLHPSIKHLFCLILASPFTSLTQSLSDRPLGTSVHMYIIPQELSLSTYTTNMISTTLSLHDNIKHTITAVRQLEDFLKHLAFNSNSLRGLLSGNAWDKRIESAKTRDDPAEAMESNDA